MTDHPSHTPKTLSLSEANALLPIVKPLIEQLQQLQRVIAQTNQQIDELTVKVSAGNGYPVQSLKARLQELTTHQLQLAEAFESALAQLEDAGAMLKDLQRGLIDFYALRDGKLVLLCWTLDEERIRYWHTLEDGFAGRQPLES